MTGSLEYDDLAPWPQHPGVKPRVAIVHDFLSQHGGAERVVLQFAKMFPEAPILTAFYDPDGTFAEFREHDVRPSPLQSKVSAASFRAQVLRYPGAFRSFDVTEYDAVLVSSSAFAHHIRHPRAIVYCHTPPRFLYAPHTYAHGRARRVAGALGPALTPLRRRDRSAAKSAAVYLANSELTARRIRRVYGIDCDVVPPPVATDHLPPVLTPLPLQRRAIVVSRLLPYKRVDVAIRACRAAGVPLTVVGDGPDRERLESIGGATTFVGRVDDADLGPLLASHNVVLVPGAEDFGLMPLEANYTGRPVIAFAAGGPRETINPGVNGYLVDNHDELLWAAAITHALEQDWDPQALRACTDRYSAGRFSTAIQTRVRSLCGVLAAPAGRPPATAKQHDRLSVTIDGVTVTADTTQPTKPAQRP
jgi:glycosyltransferase involved in cell wall biosynthesis